MTDTDRDETLDALQAQLESILSKMETVSAGGRKEARAEKRAVNIATAQEGADALTERTTNRSRILEAQFQRRCQDKLWYATVLPHQWEGIHFGAAAERWINGDEPGLGKTRQAIGWLDALGVSKAIVVCESNICAQFAGEIMDIAPHRTVFDLSRKSPAERQKMLEQIEQSEAAIVVINYEIWRRDKPLLGELMVWRAEAVIVDEAHNIKSIDTANYAGVDKLVNADNVCPQCGGTLLGLWDAKAWKEHGRKVAKPCRSCGWKRSKIKVESMNEHLETKSVKYVMFTTGTPILNEPLDLFPLLNLCNPIVFRKPSTFRDAYLTQDYHSQKWRFRKGALELLKPLIQGLFLARKAGEAGVVLPPQHIHTIPCVVDPTSYPLQLRTIQQITEAAAIMLSTGETATIMHMISIVLRKRQANVWPGGIVIRNELGDVILEVGSEVQESAKLDRVMEKTIEKHEAGHRQVVFSQFKTALVEMERRLTAAGIRVVRFDGDTPPALRQRIKTNFYKAKGETPEWDVVVAHYKTGGTGLNLTSATVTHILDEEWNPGKRDQAYGRTHRMGQDEETEVYVYRVPESIDTWMAQTIARKESMIDDFNGVATVDNSIIKSLREALMNKEML